MDSSRPDRQEAKRKAGAPTSTCWMCLLRCLEMGMRIALSAELFSAPHSPQQLIACLTERKRATSLISRAHVKAVMLTVIAPLLPVMAD